MTALAGFEFRSSFRTWITGIAVRCALESLRRPGRLDAEYVEGLQRTQPAPPDASQRIDLERAFERLPPGYRVVLVLHDVEGYTHDEIGESLGIASGTSKSQLSRARAWLRSALGSEYRVG